MSLPSQAEFQIWARYINEPSRASSLVERVLASRAKLARLGSNSSPIYSIYSKTHIRKYKRFVHVTAHVDTYVQQQT